MGEDMKKISLEYQWAIGKKTGVGWYIYNIVKELSKSSENKYILEFGKILFILSNWIFSF